ncbi:hypothetical protein BV210_15025 [Halorientalis sp. IM1011]|nr:hypothetical protein BV210_15025 [Halorientalis sp. IM1011]
MIDDLFYCVDVFDNPQQNEIDVLAMFKNSKPSILFEAGEMSWVPLSGVAFVCEIKSNLTVQNLESDLEKLEKIKQLEDKTSFNHIPMTFSGQGEVVDRTARCLVYDEKKSVDMDRITSILSENTELWDLFLIVESNEFISSPNLPSGTWASEYEETVEAMGLTEEEKNEFLKWKDLIQGRENISNDLLIQDDGLFLFLYYLSISIPFVPAVDTTKPLQMLVGYRATEKLEDQFLIEFAREIGRRSEIENPDIDDIEQLISDGDYDANEVLNGVKPAFLDRLESEDVDI